jgi:hypothetical protein
MLVIDPNRPPVIWDPFETLAIARDVLQLRRDVGPDLGDVDASVLAFEWGGVEKRNPRDVHVAGARLEGEKGSVQIGQRLVVEFAQAIRHP